MALDLLVRPNNVHWYLTACLSTKPSQARFSPLHLALLLRRRLAVLLILLALADQRADVDLFALGVVILVHVDLELRKLLVVEFLAVLFEVLLCN